MDTLQYDRPVKKLVWDEPATQNLENYWSRRDLNNFSERRGGAVVGYFSRWLEDRPRILDFDCGSGGLLATLFNRRLSATGVETSSDAREIVRTRFSGRKEFLGVHAPAEIQLIADTQGLFDAIFWLDAIQRTDDQQLAEALGEIRTLLAPGGVVLMNSPNREDIYKSQVFCPGCCTVYHPRRHLRSFSKHTLPVCLAGQSFECVHVEETHLGESFRHSPRNFLMRASRFLLQYPTDKPDLVCVARPR